MNINNNYYHSYYGSSSSSTNQNANVNANHYHLHTHQTLGRSCQCFTWNNYKINKRKGDRGKNTTPVVFIPHNSLEYYIHRLSTTPVDMWISYPQLPVVTRSKGR